MKKILLLILFMAGIAAVESSAQAGPERVQALRVAFITKSLELTPEEAQVFWPIYNNYQDKRDSCRKTLNENKRLLKEQKESLSDADYLRIANEEIKIRQREVQIAQEQQTALLKVLSPKKVALLYVAEEEFKKELIRILTEDNNTGKGGKK